MNKRTTLIGAFALLSSIVFAQIETQAVAQDRLKYDKFIYIGGGGSFPFGSNIGDYSIGANLQAGFGKRLNKVISIGGGIEFTAFLYDPEVSSNPEQGNDIFFNDTFDEAYVVTLEGGDLSLISLSFDLKFNLIPVYDNTKISVYGFARPFLTFATKTEVSGAADYYIYNYDVEDWEYIDFVEWGADDYPVLAEESTVTGGIFIGPGIEFLPSKKVSIYAQASFGYTFPIPFVSTSAYPPSFDGYFDENFPIVKEGFPSLNIQLGVNINF